MEIDPRQIYGNWAHGWALDRHTLRSRADGEAGGAERARYARFATERSELGEALFRLKYQGDRSQVAAIAAAVVAFARSRAELSDLAAVLAVPPSDTRRPFQPVEAVAAAAALGLGLPSPDDYILKIKATAALKNLDDKRGRRQELEGAFAAADGRFAGRHLLLLDDLYRSGETLKAVTAALLFSGEAGAVSVVALTTTRTRR